MKKYYASILVFSLIFIVGCYLVANYNRTANAEEIVAFQEKYDDFELIKDLVLSHREQDSFYVLQRENSEPSGTITGLYDFPIPMDQEQLDALNSLAELFTMDFSFIEISEDSVRFGGQGYHMYVYSFDGRSPEYFYDEGDGIRFSVVDLGNQWYYLRTNFR